MAEKSAMNRQQERPRRGIYAVRHRRLSQIIEQYDGNPQFGYSGGRRDLSITMDAKGGFLDRKEKDYEEKMVEDISISTISQADYNSQKQKEAEEEIEIVETGHIGVSVKPDSSNSPAAKAARAYCARMQSSPEPNPEFE